jgi:thiamine-monophosphate kinase
MNALPGFALISIAIPEKMPVEAVESLYQGMSAAASFYGLAIAGGDTSLSPSGLMISVAMNGETTEERLTLRKGARVGDMICVTGTLGGAAAGLKLLMREKYLMVEMLRNNETYNKNVMAELEEFKAAIRCQLLPDARLDIVKFFNEAGIVPTAMIDISDGLAADLGHLCKRSNTGAHILESKLPLLSEARSIADELQEDAITWALNGGEDYQLLFTLPKEQFQSIAKHRDIAVIGEITSPEEGTTMTDIYGMTIELGTAGGYDHFKS